MLRLTQCLAAAMPGRSRRVLAGRVLAGMALAGLVVAGMVSAEPALADETQLQLKAGANGDLVRSSCLPCHSVDYIPMNSSFLTRQGWEAAVNKMINVFGAPIAKDDVGKIVDYLTQNYGKPS